MPYPSTPVSAAAFANWRNRSDCRAYCQFTFLPHFEDHMNLKRKTGDVPILHYTKGINDDEPTPRMAVDLTLTPKCGETSSVFFY
jgi:hypothetical protein